VVTGRVPLGEVVEVRRHPNVYSLKASRPYYAADQPVESSGNRAPGGLAEVDDRAATFYGEAPDTERPPDPLGASGRGVVVAVAGWGLDFAHSNFRHADGTTRLLGIWDQRGGRHSSSPSPFGYGRELGSEAINRALRSAHPYEMLVYDPADVDPRGIGAHDTHVMDIAAGNGAAPGSLPGMAPAADLVFVHLKGDDTWPQQTLGDSVRLLEAVDYIVDRARLRPVVCNLSLDRTAGPHDASPLVVQALDALLAERRGLAMTLSTGNYWQAELHSSGALRQGEQAGLRWQVMPSNNEIAEMDIWYPGADEFGVELLDPTMRSLARVRLGEDQVVRNGDRIISSIYHRRHDPNNGDNEIGIFLWPDAALGTWIVKLDGQAVTDGHYHAWIERDDPAFQSRFAAGTSSPYSTTGTIANGYRTIKVGAYDGRNPSSPIAFFSSAGPTRDGRVEPDVSAPGVGVWAAQSSRPGTVRDSNGLTLKSGTSMAAPWVAGVVARTFEVAMPDLLSADEIREILMRTARRNPPADDLERLRYGAGRVDPVAAVALVRARRAGHAVDAADGLVVPDLMSAALPALLIRLGDAELHRTDAEGLPLNDRRQPPSADRLTSRPGADHAASFVLNRAYRLGYDVPVHPRGAPAEEAAGYPDAAELFDALSARGGEEARAYFTRFLDIIAMPGDLGPPLLQSGDLLLCGREDAPPAGRVAIVADPLLRDLNDPAFQGRDTAEGRGVLCIEAGEDISTLEARLGRMVLDPAGRIPDGRMIVRLRTRTIDLPRARRQLGSDPALQGLLGEVFGRQQEPPRLQQEQATAEPTSGEAYVPAGGRTYAPASDPAAFRCPPSPLSVTAASELPATAPDPGTSVRSALAAVGVGRDDLAAFERAGGMAGLRPFASRFGPSALTELFTRLRYEPGQLVSPPGSRAAFLPARLLLAVPGHFRELARRAPSAEEAHALENLGWLHMASLRDEIATATGSRWWLPAAPEFAGPFPDPLPPLSSEVQGVVLSSLFIDTTMARSDYLARFGTWDRGLPGRAWRLEAGLTPDPAGPARPFYPVLASVPAPVDVAAERRQVDQAWAGRIAATDARLPKLSDDSTEELRRCDESYLPAGLMTHASLRGLALVTDFPVTEGEVRHKLLHGLNVLAIIQPAFEAVFETVHGLGWGDLLFQCGGTLCFRGVRLPEDPHHPGRRQRAARSPSNHSYGLAIDVQTFENGQGGAGSLDPRIVSLFEAFRFRWGRCFPVPDPMHFEYCGAEC
jgi:hypothetical protein